MNLTKIRYFVEVARCGNFSEAARRLYTAQPNVSKQIAQMEQELDFSLFVRSKRAVKLTPAGQLLYDRLKDLPDELEQLFDQARQLSRREEARLNIGILEGQEVSAILLTRLNLAQALYPNLELELERNSFSNLRNGLKNGHYDLIVTLDFDVEEEKEFYSVPVCPQPPAIAIHRNHPLAQEPELEMTQLKNENFVVISPEESPVGYERLVRQCQRSGFTPHIVRKPRSLESLPGPIVLGHKRRKGIAEILHRKIGKGVDFHRRRKGRHNHCAKAVHQPLHHENAEIHHRLLEAGQGRQTANLPEHRLLQLHFSPLGQQLRGLFRHVNGNADARGVLANDRSRRRAGDPPGQHRHKQQIQHNIPHRRHRQKNQRHHGVSHRPQQAGTEIIDRRCQNSAENHQQIGPHPRQNILRHPQEPQNSVQSQIHQQIHRQRCRENEHRPMEHPQP
jgi:DNA-binding transcriptional LysR family regulator